MLRLAKEYGFYVFMDPHQDVVSPSELEDESWDADKRSGLASQEDLAHLCGRYTPAV